MSVQLTESQREAVEHNGNAAIIAAAGSGKTFTIVEKVARLVENGISLDQILLSSFTKKAGEEIQRRISKRLDLKFNETKKLKADTLHGIAADILREGGPEIGLSKEFQILESPLANLDLLRLVRTSLLKWAEAGDTQAIELIQRYDFHPSVRLLINLLQTGTNHEPSFEYDSLVTNLRAEFLKKKRSQNFLDFQDLENEWLRLLRKDDLRKKLQEKFQWIIIDEFQDINPSQWEIISQLWGDNNHLVIVGDPRQSIYRFRGAAPHLFDQVSHLIEKRGGKKFYLNDNFRSSPEVIDFVNTVSESIFSGSFPPLQCQAIHIAGQIQSHVLESKKIAEARDEEAHWISDNLLALHREGAAWKDCVLLFRSRTAIPHFIEVFKANGIPYITNDEKTLLEQTEMIQVMILLKKILYPDHDFFAEAFRYTFISPLLWNEIETAYKQMPDLKEFLSQFFAKISESFLEKSQIYLVSIQKLFSDLILLGASTLKELVAQMELLKSEGALIPSPVENQETDAVQLMTIHAAKGLEFPVVFLCDLSGRRRSSQRLFLKDANGRILLRDFDDETQGLKHKLAKSLEFEKQEEIEKEEELQESHRLLYVALTRAVKTLFFTLPPPPKNAKKSGQAKDWKDHLHESL